MASFAARMKTQHAEKMLTSLDKLRAWEWICDFTIQVGEENFPVHRTVLAACSEYFFDLLKQNGKEAQEGGIEIQGIPIAPVRHCIEFMYTGEADVTLENVDGMLLAADHFKLRDLTQLCLHFLSKNLMVENCLYVKGLYERYGYSNEVKKVEEFITENCEDLVATNGFLTLKKDHMGSYLKSPTMDSESLWSAITSWITFRTNERSSHYFELLSLNIARFSSALMLGSVWPYHLTRKSKPCRELVANSLLSDVNNFKSGITLENCFFAREICEASRHMNAPEGHNQVRLFMMKNFEDVSKKSEVLSLTKDELFQIFRSPKTKYSSEVTKWVLALKWIKHDIRDRRRFFPDLLATVKLENMPVDYIQDVVRSEQLVQDSSCCKEMVLDAFYSFANTRELSGNLATNSPVKPSTSKRTMKESTAPKTSAKRSMKESTTPKSSGPRFRRSNVSELQPPKKKSRLTPEMNSTNDGSTAPKNVSELILDKPSTTYLAFFDQVSGKVKGLNLENVQWKDLATTKVTKDDFQAVASTGNSLYLMKGVNLFLLDNAAGWKKLATKQTKPKSGAKFVTFQELLYVIENGIVSSYDIESNAWDENNPIVLSGDGFSTCCGNGFIYILGGARNPKKARRYDPLSGAISEICHMMTERQNAASTVMKDFVYVMGGASDPKFKLSTERYDPASDVWTAASNMQVQRSYLCACSHNDRIYALGGAKLAPGDRMDSVEVHEASKGKYKWRILHRMLKSAFSVTACIVEIPAN